ncbi:uncharacterized protein LOC115584440 [Xyrichtys novacula]|uniref:Uncharacterized protein LOC115584440 n=1 Tax=Xyrichtys novacula TaxID=13765 RepID=A0AAV1F4T9_XYRNO|nr:uncharacterized protein LOC115584440 [Xyrichtys novacula]
MTAGGPEYQEFIWSAIHEDFFSLRAAAVLVGLFSFCVANVNLFGVGLCCVCEKISTRWRQNGDGDKMATQPLEHVPTGPRSSCQREDPLHVGGLGELGAIAASTSTTSIQMSATRLHGRPILNSQETGEAQQDHHKILLAIIIAVILTSVLYFPYNENAARPQAQTGEGVPCFKIDFPKALMELCRTKQLKMELTFRYVADMMDLIFEKVIVDPALSLDFLPMKGRDPGTESPRGAERSLYEVEDLKLARRHQAAGAASSGL